MLVTSIFSFSQNVFYPSQNKFQFFNHIYFVVCKCFQFDQSKILLFGKKLMYVHLHTVFLLKKAPEVVQNKDKEPLICTKLASKILSIFVFVCVLRDF